MIDNGRSVTRYSPFGAVGSTETEASGRTVVAEGLTGLKTGTTDTDAAEAGTTDTEGAGSMTRDTTAVSSLVAETSIPAETGGLLANASVVAEFAFTVASVRAVSNEKAFTVASASTVSTDTASTVASSSAVAGGYGAGAGYGKGL